MPDETPAGYVTVQHVIQSTGVRPDDFLMSSTQELEEMLTRWIGYLTDQIDEYCRRHFLTEANDDLDQVPGSVRSVAERAMARWVQIARSHRDAAMVRLDDWRVGINLVDEVLPLTLRRDLPKPRKPFRGSVAHG